MKNVFKVAATAAVLCVGSSASAATLVNGSLTGQLVNGGVPAGWSVTTPSPDTNDVNNAAGGGFPYGIPAVNSSDGGTWVGIARDGTGFVESFEQTIADFVVGGSYTLGWEAANFGFSGYLGSNAIEVLLDGVGIGSGAVLALASSWNNQSVSFSATSTSHTIGFRLLNNDRSYVQIDGIGFVAPIPVPASIFMLSLGLGGLAGLRRRRNKSA